MPFVVLACFAIIAIDSVTAKAGAAMPGRHERVTPPMISHNRLARVRQRMQAVRRRCARRLASSEHPLSHRVCRHRRPRRRDATALCARRGFPLSDASRGACWRQAAERARHLAVVVASGQLRRSARRRPAEERRAPHRNRGGLDAGQPLQPAVGGAGRVGADTASRPDACPGARSDRTDRRERACGEGR